MQLQQIVPPGVPVVQSYRAGGFTVSGERFEGAVLITPAGTGGDATLTDPEGLSAARLAPLLAEARPGDLLIVGTGQRHRLLSGDLVAACRQQALRVEAMTTPSACRTYNVLVGEGRRVLAALIALP